ncbi:FkbM family methyltransferase [Paludibacter jiangxiensis]|uniref:Methyltransferase, FkbM family n=1 Tax=Paludibacter jiangxiensis TaxID=681398 RepID=A0A161LEA1_9BACT|nr:FkbM family methyltransferase [Paludibacter jiangxiensis]GAT62865.1 methyltransferase, FkbM family [Paludibacter jiangxiensis]
MKAFINRLLAHFNYQIKRIVPADQEQYFLNHLSEELKARQQMVSYYNIKLLLDVGANTGQYASLMRRIGYKERIVSFEPLKSAFNDLKQLSANDETWSCENFGLGNKTEKAAIHVSGNSYSSSLLDILPTHLSYDAESQYIGEEPIDLKRLDDIFARYYHPDDKVMLKIDTQGFEKNVLDGAIESLKKITLLQLEMSIEPLYKDEVLFTEMVNYLQSTGFELFALENGIRNPESGKLLQVDGIFVNKNIAIQ